MSALSVALCTYNGARYLESQLESIASQTRLPDELVVGDDCSTDETVHMVRRFATEVSFPVHLEINARNIGTTKNFERTISRCRGEVIALCDQDDVWLKEKLATLEGILLQNPDVGLVFSDATLIDESSRPLAGRLWESTFPLADQRMFRKGQWLNVLVRDNVVTGSTMAFRGSLRDLALPIPQLKDPIHDGWIALAVGAVSKLEFVTEPLMNYRRHSAQQVGIYPLRKPRRFRPGMDYGRPSIFFSGKTARMIDVTTKLSEMRTRLSAECKASVERLAMLDGQISSLQSMIHHYNLRGWLAPRRRDRLRPIARELLSSGYHRYSHGVVSAFRDLLRERSG